MLERFVAAEAPFPAGLPQVTNQTDSQISRMVASLSQTVATELPPAQSTEVSDAQVEFFATTANEEPLMRATAPVGEPEMIGLPFPVEAQQDVEPTELDEEEELPSALESAIIDDDSEPTILLIEDEAPTTATLVVRQEYQQLFANLRGG